LARFNTGEDLRVLLVDDHEIFREGLMSILEEVDGIQVVGEASDGAQAVEKARDLQPDVVLMDINLPAMNGIEATRKITAKMPDIRIIGLSVDSEDDMADSMIAAGAAAYRDCQTVRRSVNAFFSPFYFVPSELRGVKAGP